MSPALSPNTFDITFTVDDEEQHSFQIYKAKGIPGWRMRKNRLTQTGSPLPGEDLPIEMSDLSAGAGHSQRWTPNVYELTYPGDARDPRGVCPPSELEMITIPIPDLTGTFTEAFELANVSTSVPADLFLLGDKYCWKWQTGADHLSAEFYFNDTPLSATIYNGPAFVTVDSGFIYRAPVSPTDVWTQSSDFHARHIVTVSMVMGAGFGGDGSYQNVMVADVDGIGIKWTTGDPMQDGDWVPGSAVNVGQNQHAIRQLVAAPEAFAILKASGIWKMDGRGKARALTPYWERDTDVGYAGMCGMFYGGFALGSHPRMYDMVAFSDERQESPHNASVGAWPTPNESPLIGRQVTANTMLGTGELCIAVYNDALDESSIWLGRFRPETGVEGVGPILWHGAIQIVPGMVTLLHVSSLALPGEPALPYLWFGTTATQTYTWFGTEYPAGMYLFRCRVARGQAPLRDPTYPFATAFWKDQNYAARIYYSMTDGGGAYSNVPKSSYAIEANLGGDPGSSFATVATKVDTGEFIEQGQLAAPRGYVLETQQDGQAIQHRIDLRGGTSEEPTIVRGITPHFSLRPEMRREYDFWIDCGPSVMTNTGSTVGEDPDTQMAYLEWLQTQHDITVKISKRTIRGKILPGLTAEDLPVVNDEGYHRIVQGVFCETAESLIWGDGHEWGKFP